MKCYTSLLVAAVFAICGASDTDRPSDSVSITTDSQPADPESSPPRDQRSIGGEEINVHGAAAHLPAPQIISQHVDIEKRVPVVQSVGVPVPVPHHIPYPVQVPVHVPQPYPVEVPVQVPVYKTVTVAVEKPYPVEVEKHVPVEVLRKVHVAVPEPYPVPVPVYRTKHVYHEIIHSKKSHGW
ncbi:Hypothetical protein NTJ_13672 [Nesidiocoris tenuis]|uniref:DUF4794 domain-containing protein n=1 Tax=Nesidiocoris tenuis TaxID=355587 RepID=A0ABN7B911_9HEMI|nr:Hypothetical protein NTJ_13672 [Nesidiocoris tenuis]